MKSAGKARSNGLYRHIRTSKEIIRNLLNYYYNCLTSTDYAIKFKNYNGRVAVHFSLHNEMVAGMTIYVQEQYPDTYRLVKNTPEKVEFTLISHYDRDGSVENPLEVYIIEYPIRMVKTDYGWRIDDFHTSRYG